MTDADALLNLPIGTLVPLAAGYISYRFAFVGRDAHHKQLDALMIVVVFAAIVKSVSWVLSPAKAPDAGLFFGVAAAYSASLIWRKRLGPWCAKSLREAGFVDHDGQPSAWRTMLSEDLKGPTRLVVYLKNGSALMSDDLAQFNSAPCSCCILGEDGSIGMYVTGYLAKGTKEWVDCAPHNSDAADWGHELTIIPAAEVARVEITRPA